MRILNTVLPHAREVRQILSLCKSVFSSQSLSNHSKIHYFFFYIKIYYILTK